MVQILKRLLILEEKTFMNVDKKAYAIVATGETSLYANIILKKGVVVERENV